MTDIYQKLEIPAEDKNTSITEIQAEWIFSFLKSKNISQTVETGFAYGCSTAYIMSATAAPHIVIDPYQDLYKNLGLKNIESLGLTSKLRFEKDLSLNVLPKLLFEGIRCDFAFIDGGHRFDDIFIDWFYSDLLLRENGYIMFHDTWLPSTRHVASFILNNRNDYKQILTPIRNIFLCQKIGTDSRPWDHFNDFCVE